MKVEEYMEKDVITIKEEELATKARAIIREFGIKSLPVIDSNGKLCGIISIPEIVKLPTRTGMLVRDLMERNVVYTYPDTDLISATRIMLENGIGRLPVVDHEFRVVGILTFSNILRAFYDRGINPKKEFVYEIMTRDVVTISIDDNINKLLEIFSERWFGAVPVVKGRRVVGIVTRKVLIRRGFIRLSLDEPLPKHVPINKIMTTPVITINQNSNIKEALRIMVENEIGRLPVLNDYEEIVGIISRDDVAKAFV